MASPLHDSLPDPPRAEEKRQRIRLDNTLIPAVAALAGALIGAAVSVFITIYQIHANQHQAVDTFLLSQRQAAYSTFLTDGNQLRIDWYSYYHRHATDLANQIGSLLTKLNGDYFELVVLGPSSVSQQSLKVVTYANGMILNEHLGPPGFVIPHVNSAAATGYYSSFLTTLNELTTDMSQAVENS